MICSSLVITTVAPQSLERTSSSGPRTVLSETLSTTSPEKQAMALNVRSGQFRDSLLFAATQENDDKMGTLQISVSGIQPPILRTDAACFPESSRACR